MNVFGCDVLAGVKVNGGMAIAVLSVSLRMELLLKVQTIVVIAGNAGIRSLWPNLPVCCRKIPNP